MTSTSPLGVAFDLGTTTIAASLVDLASAARLAATSSLNPQRPWGADVLSRLQAAADPTVLAALQHSLATEMERMAEELLARVDAQPRQLACVAVAGNPAMEQIALGLPSASLAYPPFRPQFSAARETTTAELGWQRDLPAFLFPLPSGFVGGDLVAFLYGCRHSARPGTLYLDLGTNAEMALFDGTRYLATSAAAGPAFEGGNLSCGMAALPGAIAGVSLEGERLKLATIGGVAARGICGSGVLEAVAALLENGVLDRTGRIRPPEEIASNLANRVQQIDGGTAFVLHRDAKATVYLTQEDVRALQLAKGALKAGMEILLARAGLRFEDLAEVVLTGSFGAVLAPQVLKTVGVFNESMVIISGFIREGALLGVERFLVEPEGRGELEAFTEKIKVLPLSGTAAFEKRFLANLDFD
ncbi:hypothetical protein GMLC_36990 [Geomonas limicola]|uniref:Ferredoxin n=1 Tax=Geomonas limicola TaxID=2740186 RepID=A0A6V8NCF8_9BACT|nr:ASKHA domain-containing protein [Geomonas limicola]GFO70120.1 hypothetical protein GMLC_36990 [Geomonas limicola]